MSDPTSGDIALIIIVVYASVRIVWALIKWVCRGISEDVLDAVDRSIAKGCAQVESDLAYAKEVTDEAPHLTQEEKDAGFDGK